MRHTRKSKDHLRVVWIHPDFERKPKSRVDYERKYIELLEKHTETLSKLAQLRHEFEMLKLKKP